MGIPDHLPFLLKNLYAGQEATVRTRHGTTDWFKIEKGVREGCLFSPCLFNLYTEHIMRNALQGISQKERERERETKGRKKERKTDTGTKALMKQRCFSQHGVGIYTVLQGGYSQQRRRLKFQTYKTEDNPYRRERVANNHLLLYG